MYQTPLLCVRNNKIDFLPEVFRNLIPLSPRRIHVVVGASGAVRKRKMLLCLPSMPRILGATRILKDPRDSRPDLAYRSSIEARIESMLGLNLIRSQGVLK